MSSGITVAKYISALDNYGLIGGFELVYYAYIKIIERHIRRKLWCSCYKTWGRCVDPEGHKTEVTQDTFLEFSEFNRKVFSGEYKKEIINLKALLTKMSNYCVWEHLNRRRCSDLPSDSKIDLEQADYLSRDEKGSRDIVDHLILIQAIESLPIKYREALRDWIDDLSHEEISKKRGISTEYSKKLRHDANRMFRQYKDK